MASKIKIFLTSELLEQHVLFPHIFTHCALHFKHYSSVEQVDHERIEHRLIFLLKNGRNYFLLDKEKVSIFEKYEAFPLPILF